MIKMILVYALLWVIFVGMIQIIREATKKELLSVGKLMLWSIVPTILTLVTLTTFVALF